jgi:hypothetical protein
LRRRCSITGCSRHRSQERWEVCASGRSSSSRCCRRAKGRFAFDTRREFLEENGDEFLALNQALTRLAGELEGLPQKPEEIFNFVRRAQEIQVQLAFAMESDDRNTVFWIERRGEERIHQSRTYFDFEKGRLRHRGEGKTKRFPAGHAD